MISRREMLIATGLVGFSPLNWQQLSASLIARNRSQRKRCILIWLDGGPSQLDTLDPKPNAPGGHGGPLRPISTNVPGIQISESLPEIAKLMDKCAVIRSMSTTRRQHNVGRIHMHTGYLNAQTMDFPAIGAVVSYFNTEGKSHIPHYVHIGAEGRMSGCSSGFLGAQHSPLMIKGQKIQFLESRIKSPEYRRRIELLADFEATNNNSNESLFRDHRQTLEKTLEFMNGQYPAAFDLKNEPVSVRERYGKTPIGEACLQARRLVERDVSFVEVNSNGWDMHSKIYGKKGILYKAGMVDRAISALVRELESRGLLDDTLIVWMGEFGRTPKLNNVETGGRDHFPDAWSTMLIGGGIPGGQVIGKTDKSGETVVDRPVSAVDFLATVYQCLGLDHNLELTGRGDRPLPLVDRQESPNPIESLL